jgi:hypothetical protein
MEDVGIFGAILSILGPFGIFCGRFRYYLFLVYFPSFWYFVQRKIWQPWLDVLSLFRNLKRKYNESSDSAVTYPSLTAAM